MDQLYNKERKLIEDQAMKQLENIRELYPDGMRLDNGEWLSLEYLETMLVYNGHHVEMKRLKDKYDRLGGRSHHWVGINPPPDSISLLELYNKMEKIIKKYSMFSETNYLYSVEQHTEGGVRPHIHLMLENMSAKPSRIIKTLATAMELKETSINIETYRKGMLFKEHIKYIIGEKIEEKENNIKLDKEARLLYGIPDNLGKLKF